METKRDRTGRSVDGYAAKGTSRRQLMQMMGAGAAASFMAMPAIAAGSKLAAGKGAGAQPNIVVLVLDDVGFAEIGAYGSEIKTPNIDSLAAKGLRYNRFDTKAVCSPSRASLLTGRNAQTVNMEDLPPAGKAPPKDTPLGAGPSTSGEMPLNAQTLAMALKSAGYSTTALGKWHLCPMYSDAPDRNKVWMPLQRGFDYFYGFLSGHTDQYHPEIVENNDVQPDPSRPGYHLTVDLIDRAITAMDPTRESGKPKFLYLALGAAHTPLQVPKAYIDAYSGQYDKGWDEVRQERFVRQKKMGIIPANTKLPPREKGDPAWNSLDDQQKRVYSKFMETFAGFMTHTDEQIGRLLAYLKATDQFDNTLFVFLTDNGAASEGGMNGGFRKPYLDKTTLAEMDAHLDEAGTPSTYMLYQRPWAYAGDTPFRRYKMWPNLGGARTPMIISWPDHIKDQGKVRSQFIDIIDIAPTLLEAAKGSFAAKIDGVEQIPVAGQSFMGTFTSAKAKTRSVQFFELRGNRAITQGKWRAVAHHRLNSDFEDDLWLLFDTEEDYSESTDLSKVYPQKLEELKKLWWEEAKRYADPQLVKVSEKFYYVYGYNTVFD